MSNFVLMIVCLLAGVWLQRSGRLPEQAPAGIQASILHVSLPALTLAHLHRFPLDTEHLAPLFVPWLLFGVGVVFFALMAHWMKLTRASTGALMLVGGFGNTSFVGLPMIEALHGREGLGLGMAIDQLGSYLALSTIGLLVAAVYRSGHRPTSGTIARRVLTFPPFIAMMLAAALSPWPMPTPLHEALVRIGDTLAPLALLWVGTQLKLADVLSQRRLLALGLSYKLVLCPLMIVFLLSISTMASDAVERVVVIQAAMPPMIGAAVVATQAGLAPRLVAPMIGLGIPLGLLSAAAWFHLFVALS